MSGGKWIKSSMLTDEVGPGMRAARSASGNISGQSFVKDYSDGGVVAAGVGEASVVGISVDTASKISGDSIKVAYSGVVSGIADVVLNAGELVKVGVGGTVSPALQSSLAGATISSALGLSFANQPANDGIEVLSANAADKMPLIIYGTTNGGLTVVKEQITLNGTSVVSTSKVDWGVMLGAEIPRGYPTSKGTVTIREASGNATIITMAAGVRQKGVHDVAAANGRGLYHAIYAVGDGASTKTVGVVGTDATSTAQMQAVVLAGTTAVKLSDTWRTVTKLLTGDASTATTVAYKTASTLDTANLIVGTVLADAVAGASASVALAPLSRGVAASLAADNILALTVVSSAVTGTNAETDFDQTLSIPASLIKKGTIVRIRGMVRATATNSTDTLTVKAYVGSQVVTTSAAVDVANDDVCVFNVELTGRAVPGATADVAWGATSVLKTSSTASGSNANFATNGALVVKASATWSTNSGGNSCRLDQLDVEIIG